MKTKINSRFVRSGLSVLTGLVLAIVGQISLVSAADTYSDVTGVCGPTPTTITEGQSTTWKATVTAMVSNQNGGSTQTIPANELEYSWYKAGTSGWEDYQASNTKSVQYDQQATVDFVGVAIRDKQQRFDDLQVSCADLTVVKPLPPAVFKTYSDVKATCTVDPTSIEAGDSATWKVVVTAMVTTQDGGSTQTIPSSELEYSWNNVSTSGWGEYEPNANKTVKYETAGSVSNVGVDMKDKQQRFEAPQVNCPTLTVKAVTPTDPNTCTSFSDVKSSDADKEAINWVKGEGIMVGDDCKFRPDDTLKRAEILAVVLRAFNLHSETKNYCAGKSYFPDNDAAAWYFQTVCNAFQRGIVKGYTEGALKGKFGPGLSVQRGEMLAMLLRNLPESALPAVSQYKYSDVASSDWFAPYAAYAKKHSFYTSSKFNAGDFVERREVARILAKLHDLGEL